jgi:hypothetical protein
MKEFPSNMNIPFSLIESTKEVFTLYEKEEEALLYLKLLTDEAFMFTNAFAYDAIDYEHLIYIEQTFANNNNEIKQLLQEIKNEICNNYIVKQKFLERLKINSIDLDNIKRRQNISQVHLPDYWLEEFRREVEE